MLKRSFLTLLVCVPLASPSLLYADEAVIKVSVVNPLDRKVVAPVKSYLPKGAKPEDILRQRLLRGADRREDRAATLESKGHVDDAQGLYYVEQQIPLAPKEAVVLEIEVKDVWRIDPARLQALKDQAGRIVSGIRPSSKQRAATAMELQGEILKQLDRIAQRQASHTLLKAGVEKHIEAYEGNLKTLKQVEVDLATLRKLVNRL